ncbi:MAG: NFACT RNA binding domain-containing protein [Peptoniphilus sp.]|nr:NFACT RNA binding domain-containing protein [Peptoniphilus sp.]MDD7362936.1 NFACT RNA binding domain-containing protein [Bacillota bacterium]MDY6044176.1 NFACT RNA binding domain-containing protein [Peptoniphilus sp.]
MTKAVSEELKKRFLNGRIDKIYQPQHDTLVLNLRSKQERGSLLLSASANNPCAYLTKKKFQNPSVPPNFCMLLRKHLESSIITDIYQIEMDRILCIEVEGFNDLFDKVKKTLLIEMMGRHSNILLIDENRIIIDALKRVNRSISRVREVLPGIPYSLEGIIDRQNPLTETKAGFLEKSSKEDAVSAKNFFIRNYLGLSPLIASEICYRAGFSETAPMKTLDGEALYLGFKSLIDDLHAGHYKPQSISDGNKIIAFSALNLTQYPEKSKTFYDSPSELLDHTYLTRVVEDRIRQKSQNLNKQIKNYLDRALTKQEKMELELRDAKDRKKYKVYGDLLSSNAWKIDKGSDEVTLENFYDEMKPLSIPLDSTKDAIQNAAHYYKKFTKLKHAEKTLTSRIEKNRLTIQYLDSMLYNLEDAETVDEVNSIQEEFREDYLKKKFKSSSNRGHKKKSKKSSYLRFKSSDGHMIYVGRNNRQNQELTLKFARKDDYWFHVKTGPGSHVILKTERDEPTERELAECAELAAYFSRSRQSSNVEVDYTKRQFIRRHPSNQTGLVLYTDFSTLYVTPTKSLVEKLKVDEGAN